MFQNAILTLITASVFVLPGSVATD